MSQRSPLIREISDDITNQNKDAVLTAYAVGKTFTGTVLDALNLNTHTTPGIVRITNTATGTRPPISNVEGYLVTLHPNLDKNPTGSNIRQIIYPDNVGEPSPFTRVGTFAAGQPGSPVVWGDWSTLGGGMMQKKLTENTTGIPNTMYYSFGAFTLTLPDPDLFALGTKVGLIQFERNGMVKSGVCECPTSPDISNTDGTTVMGGLVYMFEVCADNLGSKDWVLEVDNSVAGVFSNLAAGIAAERDARRAADTAEAAARQEAIVEESIARNNDIDLINAALTKKGKLTKVITTTGTGFTVVATELVEFDYHLFCTGNRTIVLPPRSSITTATHGAMVVLDISPGVTVIVNEENGDSDEFTAPSDSALIVPLQFSNYAGVNQWVKITVG